MKNQKGMTLVEILVAMGLMVMVVFCFTPFMLSSLQNVQVAGDQRENLYAQKGEIEEKISEGISYEMTEELDGVAVNFVQGTTTATGTAEGLYLTSDMLTSFIARDRASLDIAPGSVSENCPSSQKITITCDFMEFTDPAEFELRENGSKAPWQVRFTIQDSNHATMEAVGNYQFDMTKLYHIYYGEDVYAALRITPSSLIAVGQDGSYYVYTSDKTWKKGAGYDGENGKIGSNTLNDVVWTGTQYVAAGEKGSWYYTENGAGWKSVSLDSRNAFNSLYTEDGNIYVGGVYSGDLMYASIKQTVANPSEIQSKITIFDYDNKEATAVAKVWNNGTSQMAWADTKHGWRLWGGWYIDYSDVNGVQIFTGNTIGDLASNNKDDTSEENRGELIAVSDTNGKIYNYVNGVWGNNGDGFNGEGVLREDKPPKALYRYTVVEGNRNITIDVEAEVSEDPHNPESPLIPQKRGNAYYVILDGTQYKLAQTDDGILCDYIYEEYFKESDITVSGNMNAVEFGNTKTEDIWVAGGNIGYAITDVNSKDIYKITYKLNTDTSEIQWEIDETVFNGSETDGDSSGSVNRRDARILYRAADAYNDPGEWQIATVPADCPTINDIEFIGGKFYAVGDGGWILVSENGETWTKMTVNGGTPNFYGIAGWGDDWGTD